MQTACVFFTMLGNVATSNSAFVEKENKKQLEELSCNKENDYMDSYRRTESANRQLRLVIATLSLRAYDVLLGPIETCRRWISSVIRASTEDNNHQK